MALEGSARTSRRAMLGMAAGAAAATAIGALVRPEAVEAANGDTVKVGGAFDGTAATQITSTADAIRGITTNTVNQSGVVALATGTTGDTFGAWCRNDSNAGVGVKGTATAAAGVTRGVHGVAASNTVLACGVLGDATATTGFATGVWGSGFSPTGYGVVGWSPGTALLSWGKSSFVRSGVVSVPKKKNYVDINLGASVALWGALGGISANTMILATIQEYRPGVAVACVRMKYPTANKARIYLTKVASTSKATKVAWFATERVW
jgi:hypothetical protein